MRLLRITADFIGEFVELRLRASLNLDLGFGGVLRNPATLEIFCLVAMISPWMMA